MLAHCDGSRRRFLKTTAATGAALASAPASRAFGQDADGAQPKVPLVTLGKTGQKVTKLGMGSSWPVSPSFVQAALLSGVRYIDTSESYENTRAEQTIGQVLERTGLRKDVYLVTKCNRYRGVADPAPVFEKQLDASLERLRTDYVDAYFIHGISGQDMSLLTDPAVKQTFERLKAAGKLRFVGFSCHDALLPELLEKAAEVGWIDHVMIQYNFRAVDHDKLQRAIDAASKANIGLVAMKTQRGADAVIEAIDNDGALYQSDQALKRMREAGIKKQVAAIKAAWADDRMQVVVSEMVNFSDLRENIAAANEPLTVKEARLLEDHRRQTAHLYCHGCGHLCETAAKGVPVATVLRYLRYYAAYGKRQEARALYQALPLQARDLAAADLAAAERACPHGLPVVDLVHTADRHLS
ncbi:aldo/keto reductase [Tautonia sociabilis]|uniref:Aldo/keto reductase n=1 Tax=Tautonia sociabilis TaxID=2080755 RepID=A0A432MHK7_9BACT|nr:aldo/keto reductase [Tautonia sociabilis]RUL86746.1 aldo/keto reductase [Tautonia sociabilis]